MKNSIMKFFVLLLCIFSVYASANKNRIEVKYYLWTGIDEGTGKLLVDYEYNTTVALKKNILRCQWDLKYYYSVKYHDGFPLKMYTYNMETHEIIKTDVFSKGILKQVETTDGTVCFQSYQDHEDRHVVNRKCSDNSSSIQYFKKSKNNTFLPHSIVYYEDEKRVKTLMVDSNTEKYKIINEKNEIVEEGLYLNADRTRDIETV